MKKSLLRKKNTYSLLTMILCGLLWASCGHNGKTPTPVQTVDYTQVSTPTFNNDSAYAFVLGQTSFGFRAPGYKGHDECGHYLAHIMRRWSDTVIIQDFSTRLWDGRDVRGRNIISVINPAAATRVLLAAHWDSRLWADHDSDPSRQKQPISGANDGASGVGVLMELARIMRQQPPTVGVDIIFFDLEDQGVPEWADRYEDDSWCKGAQYWARNPHTPYYQARYGILLDMVGTDNPRFTKEQFSVQYASTITDKVWSVAAALGYGSVFENTKTDPILDDHLYVNRLRGIPMTDIVQNSHGISFFPHWHTATDNMDNVNRETLGIVGNVLLKTIYSTK
ncbi:MAG: M28 family peptidase [Bacteroidales bacterium]|nr:M28 family peptidase [Bacteroidales bacterium]